MKNKSKIYGVQLAEAIGGRVVRVCGGPDKYAVAVEDWRYVSGYNALSAADYADDVLVLVEAFTIEMERADIAKYCRDVRETLAKIAGIPSDRVALVSDDLREIIEIVPLYEVYFRVDRKSTDFAYMITRE